MEEYRTDSIKKYEYVMESSEIREFCLAVLWEQVKCRKGTWLRLLLIVALEFLIIPEAALLVVGLILLMFVVSGIYNYTVTYKLLSGQPWCVWVEDGKFKTVRGDYSEVPCRNIQFIRMKKHLVMLGYMQAVKRPAWFVMPLRVFVNAMEREDFLNQIRNLQAEARAEYTGAACGGMANPQEYMRFHFMLDGERWVRFQKGAADILNSTSLGTPMRLYGMVIVGLVMAVATTACSYFVARTFNWMLVVFCFSITIWMILRLYCRNPEKEIRKQLRSPEIAAKVCGLWQVSLAGEGITAIMPMDMKSIYTWDSLQWLVETEEAFYLFHQDKRHYIMVAKESFVSWEQVDAFHRICADHGMQKVPSKKAFYVPGWLTWVIFALIIGVSLTVLTGKILGNTRDMTEDVMEAQREQNSGYMELDRDDYPGYVPLDKQVAVLASLGISVPEETVASMQEFMTEYDMYDLVEGSPYTWLLMDVGAPAYDEDFNLVGYSDQVFWFDFEGLDIYTDYITVLNGMLALAQGSPIESISEIREDIDDAEWERGWGTVTVSLDWQGQTYLYDMKMDYDWIDGEVLGILNPLLEQEGSQKYFYATGDDGQGAIVFFCTPQWAEEFEKKTGLLLGMSRTKADEIQ